MLAFSIDYYGIFFGATQSVELFCTYTRCTGFFCLAIIKGPPNDIYCIIEEPYKHYFTEKVSYSLKNRGKAHKWCATRQVDKLNNENFFFPGTVHVPGCLCNVF